MCFFFVCLLLLFVCVVVLPSLCTCSVMGCPNRFSFFVFWLSLFFICLIASSPRSARPSLCYFMCMADGACKGPFLVLWFFSLLLLLQWLLHALLLLPRCALVVADHHLFSLSPVCWGVRTAQKRRWSILTFGSSTTPTTSPSVATS